MAKREGSFSGCFDPHTLDKFRDLCFKQDKQYTKVLERLAEAYIYSDGAILHERPTTTISEASEEPVTVSDLQEVIERFSIQQQNLNDLTRKVSNFLSKNQFVN